VRGINPRATAVGEVEKILEKILIHEKTRGGPCYTTQKSQPRALIYKERKRGDSRGDRPSGRTVGILTTENTPPITMSRSALCS